MRAKKKHAADTAHLVMALLNDFLLRVYGGLWHAASPLLRHHKRLKEGFAERLVPDGWPFFPVSCSERAPLRLWIQAASGGEAWLTHALLPKITEVFLSFPDLAKRPLEFLCTTCTRQGLDVLEKLTPPDAPDLTPCIVSRYFPLDSPAIMQKALRQAAPDLVILLETELWPGLMATAARQGVPVLVLNGRMTEKSLASYQYMRSFWRAHAPARILAVSDADAARFATLFGAEKTGRMHNIKFDRVATAQAFSSPDGENNANSPRATCGLPEECLLAVFASVREQEEKMLLPLFRSFCMRAVKGVPLVVAVAPRHLHRVAVWERTLAAAGLPCVFRSRGLYPFPAKAVLPLPVYLWDTFGELQMLYAAADAVFVGGSLADLGGQNFLEALAQGVTPLLGSYLDNFLWVGEELFAEKLAIRTDGPEDLQKKFCAQLAQGLPGSDAHALGATTWRAFRQRKKDDIQQRFTAWLAPCTGGSTQGARAAADMVLAFPRSRPLGA